MTRFTAGGEGFYDLQDIVDALGQQSKASNTTRPKTKATKIDDPLSYAQPFCDFLTQNPTVFHAVAAVASKLDAAGYSRLSERDAWTSLKAGGKYYVVRNSSSLVAFSIGRGYKVGNGIAMIAGHVDALTAKLKPISNVDNKAGYVQLGVAPYAGGLNSTWWDRDLAIAGRVMVRDAKGKITEKLVDLKEPIARIPTLAPHFGAVSQGPFNKETQMVPIIGLESAASQQAGKDKNASGTSEGNDAETFASTQPPRLVKAVASQLGVADYSSIVNWELELYDIQPATLGGLDKEFIYAGRIDDKLCSWAGVEGLLASDTDTSSDSIKLVGLFDDEEIGSLLRQGARGNFLPSTVERIVSSFTPSGSIPSIGQTYANSFLASADVTHAVNPNFLNAYLPRHAPELNVGVAVSADSNGHMTTDSASTALFQRIASKSNSKLQVFQIRNDVRSGGTVGPMLSSMTGVRAIDVGIPQLSMHSIRATTGSLDPGLGVRLFKGFFDFYQEVDKEFQ